jgi:hypothetical protein
MEQRARVCSFARSYKIPALPILAAMRMTKLEAGRGKRFSTKRSWWPCTVIRSKFEPEFGREKAVEC